MRPRLALLLLAIAPAVALAQNVRPAGWIVRTDSALPDTTVSHRLMPPGWHMTTGPASIIYHPDNRAHGRFAVEAEIYLFPGDSDAGYGVFLGGRDLDSTSAAWTAFLVTRHGGAVIERRQNGVSSVLYPLTHAASVKPHTGQGTAQNVLRVLVQGDSVVFSANGERITALPSRDLPLDGTFGFRLGTGVNLHVSNLDLISRLAPYPVKR